MKMKDMRKLHRVIRHNHDEMYYNIIKNGSVYYLERNIIHGKIDVGYHAHVVITHLQHMTKP